MPYPEAGSIPLLVCGVLVVLAGGTGCATQPPLDERPFRRPSEIRLSIDSLAASRQIFQGTYSKVRYPKLGTYDIAHRDDPATCAHAKSWKTASISEAPESLGCGALDGALTLLLLPVIVVLLPVIIVAKISTIGMVEDPKANAEKTKHLREVLNDPVLMRLDETFADAFKSELGWTQPTLPSGCPEAIEGSAAVPCIEVAIERIELLEQFQRTQTVILCARGQAYPKESASTRVFQTCRREAWHSDAMYAKGTDEAAFIARLSKSIRQLGTDMAQGLAN